MLQPIRAQISLALRASHWKTLVVVCIVALNSSTKVFRNEARSLGHSEGGIHASPETHSDELMWFHLVAPVSANSTENDDVAVSAEVYCYGYQVVVENLSDQTVYFELSTYFLGPGHEGWGWTSPHYLEPGQMSEDHDVWAGDMLAGSWYFRVTVDVFAADGTPIAQEVFELDGNCLALHWMVVDAAEAWQDGDDVHICWTTPYTNMNYFEGWQLVRYGPDWQRGDPVFYPGHPEGICAVDDTIYREGCYHYRIDWLDPLGNARIQDEELWPELWYDGVYLQYIPMAYR